VPEEKGDRQYFGNNYKNAANIICGQGHQEDDARLVSSLMSTSLVNAAILRCEIPHHIVKIIKRKKARRLISAQLIHLSITTTINRYKTRV